MSSARVKEVVERINGYVGYMRAAGKPVERVTILLADHAGITECLKKDEALPGFKLENNKLYFHGTPVVSIGESNE